MEGTPVLIPAGQVKAMVHQHTPLLPKARDAAHMDFLYNLNTTGSEVSAPLLTSRTFHMQLQLP